MLSGLKPLFKMNIFLQCRQTAKCKLNSLFILSEVKPGEWSPCVYVVCVCVCWRVVGGWGGGGGGGGSLVRLMLQGQEV